MHAYGFVCMCVCVYMCICACMYVYVHMHFCLSQSVYLAYDECPLVQGCNFELYCLSINTNVYMHAFRGQYWHQFQTT